MNERSLPNQGTECANHSGVAGEAICSICGKPVCADCFVRLSFGIVCDDPGHKTILEELTIAFRSNSEFEADMVVRNFQDDGIESKMFSSRAFKQTIGEDAQDVVNVFVRRSELQRAGQVLNALGLTSFDHEMQKSN
jgi:hypothetical protein